MATVTVRTKPPTVRKNFGERVFYKTAGRLFLYRARARKAVKLAEQHLLKKY